MKPTPRNREVEPPVQRISQHPFRSDWRDEAACAGMAPRFDTDQPEQVQAQAKRICAGCPVSSECWIDAIATNAVGVIRAGRVMRRAGHAVEVPATVPLPFPISPISPSKVGISA